MNSTTENGAASSEPQPNTIDLTLAEAISAAVLLLDYAAEHKTDIDETIIETIIKAKHVANTQALKER